MGALADQPLLLLLAAHHIQAQGTMAFCGKSLWPCQPATQPAPLTTLPPPPPAPPACLCLLQVGGSIIFIVCHWYRRWTGRDTDKAVRSSPSGAALPRGAAAAAGGVPGPNGSSKSFYSSETGGSEVEIAIQPGSARFAGGQTFVPPQSGEQGRGAVLVGAGVLCWWERAGITGYPFFHSSAHGSC